MATRKLINEHNHHIAPKAIFLTRAARLANLHDYLINLNLQRTRTG
jgi:hypothetical protein